MSKPTPKVVYVVTSGEYSSYGICAIFDRRELAEAMVEGHDGYGIEEYVLNPGLDQYNAGRSRWSVRLRKDGTVIRTSEVGWSWSDDEWEPRLTYESAARSDFSVQETIVAIVIQCDVWAQDREQAVKAANEIRGQWIASGQWDRAESEMRATWAQFRNPDLWRDETNAKGNR